jgi:polyphenol oxidase
MSVEAFPRLKYCDAFFSTQKDGNLSTKYFARDSEKNRQQFFAKNFGGRSGHVFCEQIHGIDVSVVTQIDSGKKIVATDGLFTKEKNLILGVETADCLPILFASEKAVAAVHAGWRGLANGIITKVANCFAKENIQASEILVSIGPHIQVCCFEVQADLIEIFRDYSDAIRTENGKKYLDLAKIAILQLTKAGFLRKNISNIEACTYCHGDYYSYRREGQNLSGQMMAIIRLN